VTPSPDTSLQDPPDDAADSRVDRPAPVATRRGVGWPPTLSTVLGVGLGVWGLYLGLARLADNSFLTHLATGRLILLEGSIPTGDPYTFTASGEPWVVQSWLASVLYAVVERLGGPDGVRVLVAVLTVGLVACIWALTRAADGVVARFGIGAVAVAVGALVWGPRPLMFGLLFLAAALVVVERRAAPWLLLPIFWVWVNTHGSFPLGLLALGLLACGRRLDGESAAVELRALLWAVGGTLLGAVNPLGPKLLTFPLRMFERQDQFQYIVEWQSPDFSGSLARIFLVQVLVAVLLLVRRPSWRAALPLVVFVALALTASRNIAPASIVLLPGMATAAAGLGSLRGDRRSPVTAVATIGLLALGAIVAVSMLGKPAFDMEPYPVDAVAWADQQGLLQPGPRILASDSNGNYLELLRGRDAGVFADDRVDMLPAGVVDDLKGLLDGRQTAPAVLSRWQPDVVIWSRTAPLAGTLRSDPSWVVGYEDDEWTVLVPLEASS
jgi:hypothetical protein